MQDAAATMLAATVAAPGEAVLGTAPLPEPGPGQVRVRLEGSGICGSDLPVWQGREWFDYPREAGAPGHEGWGVVDAIGDDVELEAGMRVASLGYRAYAQYDVADATSVIPLPSQLDGRPFPGEPLGCAVNVFRRSDIQPGQRVAIVGVGFLGALVMQLALRAGAEVIAFSRRQEALGAARAMGAKQTIALADDPLRLDGACDRVVEAAGVQQTLDLAARLTRVRGRLVIAGFHQDGHRSVDMQLWNWRGIDVVNAHERDPRIYADGVRRAAELAARGELDPWPLFTHEFALDRLDEAFTTAIERPAGFMKALVRA